MGPSIRGDDTRHPNRDCASHSRCALDARIVCHHERAASFRAQTRGAPTDLREVIALGSQFWEPGHDEVARRHAVRVSLPNPTINTERSSGGHAALVDRFRLTLRRTCEQDEREKKREREACAERACHNACGQSEHAREMETRNNAGASCVCL